MHYQTFSCIPAHIEKLLSDKKIANDLKVELERILPTVSISILNDLFLAMKCLNYLVLSSSQLYIGDFLSRSHSYRQISEAGLNIKKKLDKPSRASYRNFY